MCLCKSNKLQLMLFYIKNLLYYDEKNCYHGLQDRKPFLFIVKRTDLILSFNDIVCYVNNIRGMRITGDCMHQARQCGN